MTPDPTVQEEATGQIILVVKRARVSVDFIPPEDGEDEYAELEVLFRVTVYTVLADEALIGALYDARNE